MTTACPECDNGLTVGSGTRLSEILECGDCRSELEVVSVEPLILAIAPEAEEDWGE
ncbi:lysine biosynthesis protein LysW [Micromonospora sp. KC723]|uniref:lysine biosynthesis protein LysW n=1 Tax=Micromonospora sp. KC723 TaxID=2530381 RepID=UPI00104ABCA4|nr:lysine biosynthesis protein LysW [Micromonospora sp. KC723]TDB78269.1 lysine biosynthesis protein LysW [Micromonospora sp. KC723]